MDSHEISGGAIDYSAMAAPIGVGDVPAKLVGARDEVEILRAVAAGEAAATRILLDVHMPTVYGFIFGRLGGRSAASDDVIQETLMEACRSAHTFRGDASLATWLCAIARRRIARYFEAERKSEEAGRFLTAVPSDLEGDADRRDHVTRALRQLSPSHRQALVFKYLDDMTVEQIAEQMDKSRVEVQSLLQRARNSFKEAFHSGQ